MTDDATRSEADVEVSEERIQATPRAALWACLLLALFTLIAFEPALDHEFVTFDDDDYVTHSPYTAEGLSWQNVVRAFREPHASNWHPLTFVSHMVDLELFGLNPRGHHLTSIVVHVANVSILFLVLRAMTGPEALVRSFFVAILFAVHPLRAESVAWVSERKDVLCGLFFLLTLAAYLRWVRRRTAGRYLVVVVCFALALLSKPMAVTLPCVLLLLDVWPLRRLGEPAELLRRLDPRSLGRLVAEKVPLLAMSALGIWSTVLAQGRTLEASAGEPLGLRLGNASLSYVRYLAKTFWPTDLAFYYPYPDQVAAWQVAAAAALLAGITAGAILLWRRQPAVLVGWLWFLGMLVPVIGIVRAGDQAMADRFTYLPSIGLALAVVWGLRSLAETPSSRLALALAATASALLLIPLTRAQVRVWSDSETLFRDALAKTERNYVAHLNLAEVLRAQGRVDEALMHYQAAADAGPDVAATHGALGQMLRLLGQPGEAIGPLRRAVELSPWDLRAIVNLASALAATGGEAEAEELLTRLVTVQPDNLQAHWGLGDLLARRGDVAAALRHYRAAARLAPGNPVLLRAIELLETQQSAPSGEP